MPFLSIRKIARAVAETICNPTVMLNSYDEIINDCFKDFAAPESEHNWSQRNMLCKRLSAQLGKTKPTVPKDFYERIRPLIDSFLNSAASERTALAVSACTLLGDITKTIGSLIHPHLDYILPKLITVCGSTKRLMQNSSHQTILTICQTAGYNPRLLHHICSAFNEKGKSIPKFAPIWLTTLLQTYQYTFDADKDYPLIEKAIIAGLNHGEKETREATRATYWTYAKLEKNTSLKIMEGLNPHAATALKADSNNPNKSSEPAKPARPESALAQIRAAKTKTQALPIPNANANANAKRNITPMSAMSFQSADFPFGLPDRIGEPDGAMVLMPASPTRQEEHKQWMEEWREDYEVRKGWRKPAPKPKVEPEGSSLKTLMAAPLRRPRVVATPMSTQNHPVARPTSKGETSKKPTEPTQRPAAEKREGRQTPTILEDNDASLHTSTSKKSSLHTSHKSDSFKTSTTRPSSSSSEPAGPKNPKRPTVQPRSLDALPLRHQKSASASEPRAHTVIPAPTLKTMSPPHVIDGKENADIDRPQKQTVSQSGDPLDKARRSLAAITEALRHGRLDVLGYRKLKKLVETYPKQLFTSSEQFEDFYALLISSMASLDEYSEPREQRTANFNHPFYNRYAMVQVAISLLDNYVQYGEPEPGMTLVALLKARGTHHDDHFQAVESIKTATRLVLSLPAITMNPHPVIDTMVDALLELEHTIYTNDPAYTPSTNSRPPVTALEKSQWPQSSAHDPLSYTSEFGTSIPKLPLRLPVVMGFGLDILTTLLLHATQSGRRLYEVQEQQLSYLAKAVLATYRQLIKREIMGFCTALYRMIRPEERFFAFFEDESDRNLVYYCVKTQLNPARGQGYTAKLVEDPRLLPSSSGGSGWTDATFDCGSEESANWKVLGISE